MNNKKLEMIFEGRGDIYARMQELDPIAIISYSLPTHPLLFDKELDVICNSKEFERQVERGYETLSPRWRIWINKKVHVKLLIGLNGIMMGSYNFSRSGMSDSHEGVIVLPKKFQDEYNKCLEQFYILKSRSTEKFNGDMRKKAIGVENNEKGDSRSI